MRDSLKTRSSAEAVAHKMRLYVPTRQCTKGLPGWRDLMRF